MTVPAITREDWTSRIRATWQRSVVAIIETGKLIVEAKASLPHGDFLAMIESDLPFEARQAQRLMAIAGDPKLVNATHESYLPAHVSTLYELTKLEPETFQARIDDGTICADMERADISTAVKQERRVRREVSLGALQQALPTKRFGVIIADPEWDRAVYSRDTGMDRHAANQYPVSSDEVIASRDVASIAADDSVCGLWCTDPHRGVAVLRAWGFEAKSYFVWVKDIVELDVPPDIRTKLGIGERRILMTVGAAGMGFWNRDRDELLLVGTRGKPPCPAPGTQGESVWFAARPRDAKGKIIHSAKPECSLTWFDEHFPNMPKMELNRRGPARPGWSAWGNESEATEAS